MSRDPYFEVKAEVETSLISAKALHSSYRRIRLTLPEESHSNSEELRWSREELRSVLRNLRDDLDELDQVVTVLEKNDSQNQDQDQRQDQDLNLRSSFGSPSSVNKKFGISESEIKKRRRWIREAKDQLNEMERSLESNRSEIEPTSEQDYDHPLLSSKSSSRFDHQRMKDKKGRKYDDYDQGRRDYSSDDDDKKRIKKDSFGSKTKRFHKPFRDRSGIGIDDEDESETFNQEHQIMMINQQDRTLSTISGVVGVLREQANLMGREIGDQNIMIEELNENVDRTESRLTRANKKLNRFVEDNKNSKSSWLILILIVVLVFLLICIILV